MKTQRPNPLTQDEATTQESTPFAITDEGSANWYLRRMATIAAEKIRIAAQAEKMIAELDADAQGLKFLYQHQLEAYTRAELASRGNRRKTLHLLQGSCAFKTVPPSVRVGDPAAAFAYAKENALPCIETTERLDNAEYKKLAGDALLPGMERTESYESFSVKFGGKADPEPTPNA